MVNALSHGMAFAFTIFFLHIFHKIRQIDKINKIKVNNALTTFIMLQSAKKH